MLLRVGYVLKTRAVIGGDDLRGGHRLRPEGTRCHSRAMRQKYLIIIKYQQLTLDLLGSLGLRRFELGGKVCMISANLHDGKARNVSWVCKLNMHCAQSF